MFGERELVDPSAPPEPRFIPWVTIALAVANVVVFGIEIAAGANAVTPTPQKIFDLGGNFGPVTLDGEPWRLLTSMFLHYGVLHIGMNMVGLVDGGRHVEKMFGHGGFAAMYLFAGLAGSLASATKGGAISAGASGAIFGIFGAFGAYLLLHKDTLDRAKLAKQSRGLMAFLAYNLLFGISAKGIDMTAHIGGLAGGFVAGLALQAGKSAASQRLVRALAVGVLGSAAVVGVALAMNPPKAEAWLESSKTAFDTFAKLEAKVLAAYNKLAEDKPSDDDAVAVLDKEIIPAWKAAGELLPQIKAAPNGLDRLIKPYWQARMTALLALRDAMAKHDLEAVKAAAAQFNTAAEQLEQAAGP